MKLIPTTDPTAAIAGLLDEAAELATAATAKLGEVLAIAERNAAFIQDRAWFKSRPDRSFRARLATQQEIKDLHSRGAWPPGWVPDRELLRLAIVKIDSERTGIEVLYHICWCRTGSRRSASSKPCGAQISIADIAAGRGSEQHK